MEKKLKINWLTTLVVLIYPLLIVNLVVLYIYFYGIGKTEIMLFIITYYICNISVGLGFHRLWSHAAYKTNKFIETILMIATSATLQGPVIAWVADHTKHHAYADGELDPHTPVKYKNKLVGFLWAHLGWMMIGESTYKNIDRGTMQRLGKNKILVFQFKNYWQLATFMNVVVPLAIGFIIDNSTKGLLMGFLFMGLGRAFQQQMTFCVNSVCHILGSKKYANDSSGDIWWLAFLLLGENWHNYHHAFGKDYRNGHKWYHLDVHKWLIAIMEKFGLAYDLVRTPDDRISAKMNEMKSHSISAFQNRLQFVEETASKISALARQKISDIEQCTAKKVLKKLSSLEKASKRLAERASMLAKSSDRLSEKVVYKINKKLQSIEKTFRSAIIAN